MRDAMSLSDQAIAFGGGRLEEGPVRQMLGSVDRQHVQRIIEAVAAADGAGLVAAVDALRQLGLSASGTLEELATALQRMAVIQAVPTVTDPDDPDSATWQALAPLLQPDETQLFARASRVEPGARRVQRLIDVALALAGVQTRWAGGAEPPKS